MEEERRKIIIMPGNKSMLAAEDMQNISLSTRKLFDLIRRCFKSHIWSENLFTKEIKGFLMIHLEIKNLTGAILRS